MSDTYPSLKNFCLPNKTNYFHRQNRPEFLHLESQASLTVIDFHKDNPPIIPPETPIDDALLDIKLIGLPVLLVIDDHDDIIGVVTSKDIQGDKPIEVSNKLRITHSQITVKHIMTPTTKVHAINAGSLTNAQVGHVVQTLYELQCQYLLVVETSEQSEQPVVVGLISRSLLSRQLHTDLGVKLTESQSLADLQGKIR